MPQRTPSPDLTEGILTPQAVRSLKRRHLRTPRQHASQRHPQHLDGSNSDPEFMANLTQMMFVSGETTEPSIDTIAVIESIVQEQVKEVVCHPLPRFLLLKNLVEHYRTSADEPTSYAVVLRLPIAALNAALALTRFCSSFAITKPSVIAFVIFSLGRTSEKTLRRATTIVKQMTAFLRKRQPHRIWRHVA